MSINTDNIPEAEQPNVMSAFWVLLGQAEQHAWDSKSAFDRQQVEQYYKLWNRISGQNLVPGWLNTG